MLLPSGCVFRGLEVPYCAVAPESCRRTAGDVCHHGQVPPAASHNDVTCLSLQWKYFDMITEQRVACMAVVETVIRTTLLTLDKEIRPGRLDTCLQRRRGSKP